MSEKESCDYSDSVIVGQPIAVVHKVVPVYLYASWAAIENILYTGELRLTLVERCNDLYDMWPSFETDEEKDVFMKNWERTNKAMFCFSRTPNSTALWGHYADRGAGGVLRFEFPLFRISVNSWSEAPVILIGEKITPEKKDSYVDVSKPLIIQKVRYETERPKNEIGWEIAQYVNFLSTKGKEWEYEKEVRVVASRKNPQYNFRVQNGDYYSKILMQYFSGIAIGPRANVRIDYVKRLIESIPSHIRLAWTKFDVDSIHIAKVSNTHYSVDTNWDETSENDFSDIPIMPWSLLEEKFSAIE